MGTTALLLGAVGLGLGLAAGYFGRRAIAGQAGKDADTEITKKISGAESQAKEIILEAKEKAAATLTEAQNEERERKREVSAIETRLLKREELLDERGSTLDKESSAVKRQAEELKTQETEVAGLRAEIVTRLERVGGLSADEAKTEIVRQVKQAN